MFLDKETKMPNLIVEGYLCLISQLYYDEFML